MECIWVSSNEVDEPRAYYTEWSKSEREKQIPSTNAYIWSLERWYWWNYLQGSNGDTFCQNSPPWPICLGWPHMAWLSFIEVDEAGVHVIRWPVICDCGFSVSALWCPLSLCTISLGFSYLGHGICLHNCSRNAQPLLLTSHVTKILEFQLQYQFFQWIFRIHFLQDSLVGLPCSPGNLKSLLQHHSSKALILCIESLPFFSPSSFPYTKKRIQKEQVKLQTEQILLNHGIV